ncbi:alcohol dehydrogenase catalytic domain-containing protein [Salana multivorans]
MNVGHGSVVERTAVVVTGREVAVVTEVMPPLEDGHVRVELHAVGICHSDIAAIAAREYEEPVHRGHEAAGVVVESLTPGIPVGTRVAAYVGDAYATHVDAPAHRVVVLDDACSMLDAALAEPVACVIGGVEMLRVTHCDEVVVVGAGFMGLVATRYLALLVHAVTVIEPVAARREVARGAGARRVLEPAEADSACPDGASVVIEATGGARGLDLAGSLVATDGTLGILGYHQSEQGLRTVPMQQWNFRAITVRNLHHRSEENVLRWMDRAQRSAAQGGIVPSMFVDAVLSLDDAPTALAAVPAAEAAIKPVFALR